MSYKIGDIAEVNGGRYKLVKGEECEKCCLNDKAECQMLPPCDGNGGHFIKVDAGENVVLNIQHVSNLAKFCKKIAKQEDCPPEFIEIVNKEFWNLIQLVANCYI